MKRRGMSSRGQSLVEVLLAIAIGAILVTAGVALLVPALRSNTQAAKVQVASALGKELLDNVRVWAEGDWNNMLSVTATGTNYYLNTSSSPYTISAASSSESLLIGTTTYWRYFYLSDVYRASAGYVMSGGTYDPSTKQVTVVYGWQGGTTSTMSAYVVRGRNDVFYQNDWSGGPAPSSTITSADNKFATSTGVDYGKVTGAICATPPGCL